MDTSDMVGGRLIVWLRTQVWVSYKALQPNQRSYLNAFACLVLFLIFRPFDWELKEVFQVSAIFFWGLAMISDLLSLYKKTAETLLGKLFYLAAFAFGTNVAIAIAAQVVNSLIGADPGELTHTIAFTSFLVAPPLLLFISIIVLFIATGFFMLFFMFQTLPDDGTRVMLFPWYRSDEQIVRFRVLTTLVQMVSFIVIFGFAYKWSQDENTAYGDFVESRTKWFLYTLEMYGKTQCQIKQGQKVAFLGDGQILVGSKEGDDIAFVVQQCSSSVVTP